MGFVANFIGFPEMQKFWISVKIWQSYREFKSGNFFERQWSLINNANYLRFFFYQQKQMQMTNHSAVSRKSRLIIDELFLIWLRKLAD